MVLALRASNLILAGVAVVMHMLALNSFAQSGPASPPVTTTAAAPSGGTDGSKVDGYQFDPNTVLRDPFEAPYIEKQAVNEAEEIIRFEVKEMKVVAIMKGSGASRIMVKLPNGHYHILQVGDVMGKTRDTIYKIDDSSVTMEKMLRDFKGNKKAQIYTIDLEPKGKT